jgi:hypothetical protein
VWFSQIESSAHSQNEGVRGFKQGSKAIEKEKRIWRVIEKRFAGSAAGKGRSCS